MTYSCIFYDKTSYARDKKDNQNTGSKYKE
jgi:hypothetical protein